MQSLYVEQFSYDQACFQICKSTAGFSLTIWSGVAGAGLPN